MTAAGNCAAKLFQQFKHCAYCNSVTDVSDNTALSTAFKAVARKAIRTREVPMWTCAISTLLKKHGKKLEAGLSALSLDAP